MEAVYALNIGNFRSTSKTKDDWKNIYVINDNLAKKVKVDINIKKSTLKCIN